MYLLIFFIRTLLVFLYAEYLYVASKPLHNNTILVTTFEFTKYANKLWNYFTTRRTNVTRKSNLSTYSVLHVACLFKEENPYTFCNTFYKYVTVSFV